MEKIVKFLFSGGIKFSDLSLAQLLELSHLCRVMLLTEVKVKVDDYIKQSILLDSGADTELWPELISGLKLANQYSLTRIEETIIEELHFAMTFDIPNYVKGSDSFKTLSFSSMKAIVLFDGNYLSYPPTTKQRLEVFMLWLSENSVTEFEKNEIVESFDLEDFTVKELLTIVRNSGFYPVERIDNRVLELFKDKDNLLNVKDMEIQKLKGTATVDTEDVEEAYHPKLHFRRFRS